MHRKSARLFNNDRKRAVPNDHESQLSITTCDFAGKHIFQARKGDKILHVIQGKESTKIR
jgi:hypothetical protein